MFQSATGVLALTLIALSGPGAYAQEAHGARTGDNVVRMEGEIEGVPFSSAIRAGGMIYLSGQIGNLPGSRELADGVAGQTRQALENIQAVLKAADATLYDVVKCTVFLDNIDDWAAMNEVYMTFWEGAPPARSALGADGLALGALLEIECLARDPTAAPNRD
jgi:reactive intermediate/imine deaminase